MPTQENYTKPFPSRLRKLIESRETTITALAKELKISRQAVSQYADGSAQPNIEKLVSIARFFHVSTDYLVGLSNYEEKVSEGITAQDMGLSEGFARGLRTLHNTPGGEQYIYVLNELAQCKNFSGLLEQIGRYIRKLDYIKSKIDHLPAGSLSSEELNIRIEKFLVSDVLADMLDELCPPPDWKAGKEAALSRSQKYKEVLEVSENDSGK